MLSHGPRYWGGFFRINGSLWGHLYPFRGRYSPQGGGKIRVIGNSGSVSGSKGQLHEGTRIGKGDGRGKVYPHPPFFV